MSDRRPWQWLIPMHDSSSPSPAVSRPNCTWDTAITVRDLGELVAQWLEGAGDYPAHCSVDPETEPLVPALTTINRAGFATNFSQPGDEDSIAGWAQRAAVSGFCDDFVGEQLHKLVFTSDIVLITNPPGTTNHVGVVITRHHCEHEPLTWAGMTHSSTSIEDEYPAALADSLQKAWQVTLFDPVWGRNDVLWPALVDVLRGD